MLNLLLKDFKLIFAGKGSVRNNILSAIFSLVLFACFLLIEAFLFLMILKKIKNYNEATIPFLTLFLFIISCIMIVLDAMQAKKLFFNEKDTQQLIIHPVSNAQIVLSKLIFLFFSHYVTTVVLIYPILISYGMLMGKTVMFYYIGVFYPLLSFFFEVGIALILVYPLKLLSDFLKKYTLIQFILSVLIMFGACFLYDAVLTGFMDLVVNNDIGSLFTVESIATLSALRKFMVPANFYADIFFSSITGKLIPCICIFMGIFTLGATLAIVSFNYFRGIKINNPKKKIKEQNKLPSLTKVLLKKELLLLFKDSDNIFSFTGLLMIQPFLVYVIVSSLNSVFSSGTFSYYMSALPELIPLINVLIIMLFSVIINSGASQYIQAEGANAKIMKTIPVDPLTQLLIKVSVPLALSFVSLLITTLVLVITQCISFITFIFATLLTALLLVVFVVLSMKEELTFKQNTARKISLSAIYAYLLPVFFFAGALMGAIFGFSLVVAYLFGLVFFVLLCLPHFIRLKRKLMSAFLDMEPVI